jgi:SAM-dependent methyltransferase
MSAEFDTVAAWTAQVCTRLGRPYYLPAACRGSGGPPALDWLSDRLDLRESLTLLDCGAGVGGPAAYAAQTRGVRPVLFDPEAGACRAAARLFGHPTARASGTALPVADGTVDAAWSLAVLCTVSDQLALLRELRRVVRPAARIGLLVYLAARRIASDECPSGNQFPTPESLQGLCDRAGLSVVDEVDMSELAAIPQDWSARADRVDAELDVLHRHDHTWQIAREQSERMAALIDGAAVRATLFCLRAS